MLVGLVLVDKIYLDLKCLLYKMASNFLQPGVFIIENNSSCSIETIDTSSKNKFSWSWLKEKDVNEDYLSKYVRKVSKDGVAMCLFCKAELKYGRHGRSCFVQRMSCIRISLHTFKTQA